LTGCWNIRGFRELLALGFDDARQHGTDLAVCHLYVNNLQEIADAARYTNLDAVTTLLVQVLRQRLPDLALRVDLIGAVSIFGDDAGRLLQATAAGDARDVRLRVAAAHFDKAQAERLAREVMALYTCGPAGGGGVRTALTPRLNTLSCLVPRDAVPAHFSLLDEDALP
jgi:GGDEF domain-containing protein